MARYDKSIAGAGTHRAPIGFNTVAGDLNKIFAVGLDVNGRLVKGAGTSGIVGLLVVDRAKVIGDQVDYMDHGEIVEAANSDGTTALAAGIQVHAVAATGIVQAAGGVGTKPVGHTVEGGVIANTRLVVNVGNQAVS